MSQSHSIIPPFPAEIDRVAFAHWLTGFTDGEGSFFLRQTRQIRQPQKPPNPIATFRIALRADDRPVLEKVQSFFGCGILSYGSNARSKISSAKPVAIYDISRLEDLAKVIVPHFENFPLRAKKRNDFSIWKEAVAFMWSIKQRKTIYRRSGQRHQGTFPKWTTAEREHFNSLMQSLKEGRVFMAPLLPPPPLPEQPIPGLFDNQL